jgi:threonine dehydratase
VEKYAPDAVLIPASNHPDVMAGQGTIAMELLEQVNRWRWLALKKLMFVSPFHVNVL